jgi:UDP-glucoronosyl and UDP-glucosyl transferase
VRALFTTLPGKGHLRGLLPVAKALQDAGHESAVCSAASFEPHVKACGLQFFAAGEDWLIDDAQLLQRLADATGPDLSALAGPDPSAWAHWATNNEFMRVIAQAMASDVTEIAASWQADLILPDVVELGGFTAAQKLGVPHVSIGTSAGTARDLTAQLAEPVSWLREAAGLPPDRTLAHLYRYLHLISAPPVFDGPQATIPPVTRFLRRDAATAEAAALPDWARGGSRPLALVSLGTVFYRFTEVYQAIVEQLREADVEIGVAIGPDQDPGCLGPQPPNVHVERWLPLPLLFPRCDVFVTHGGFNSTMEALAQGVPLVVVPMSGDEPYCAERCESLGVGLAIRPQQRLSGQIRDAALAVLADSSYREAARRFAAANDALPRPGAIVPVLEDLAQPGSPALSATRP